MSATRSTRQHSRIDAAIGTSPFHPYFNEPWHFEYNPEGMAAKMVAGAKAWKQQHTQV
jgi:hypothetical protein